MYVCNAKREPPATWTHSIFLAGPTPRDSETSSWRPEALKILEEMGYGGVVFVPEEKSGDWKGSYTDQAEWEEMGLEMADRIVFWVPRDLRTMPAFTTNVEFGRYVQSGKAVLGHPAGAPKTRYLDWLGEQNDVPVFDTLYETLEEAVRDWQTKGASRSGGERYVPMDLWNTPMFQAWYQNLKQAGNRLDEARVRWIFKIPGKPDLGVFSYVLWAKVWIAAEGRWKENEWTFARTDIACVVLYYSDPVDPDNGARIENLLRTKILLVKEFRVSARTDDGLIHEVPGGSCEAADDSAKESAAREVYEETGLVIAKDRLRYIGSRQAMGTVSSHHIHGYAAELTRVEIEQAEKLMATEETFGEEQDSERTYVEVVTVKDMLRDGLVDWTTVGLVMRALSSTY